MISLIETFEEDIMYNNGWSGLRGIELTNTKKFKSVTELNKYIENQKNKYLNYTYQVIYSKFDYIILLLKEQILQTEPTLNSEIITEEINIWLNKKYLHFQNKTPLQMIINGHGRNVINLLEQLVV